MGVCGCYQPRAGGCDACNPHGDRWWGVHNPFPAHMEPRGCICPPGAEKTCQGIGCPRRGYSVSNGTTTVPFTLTTTKIPPPNT